MKIGNIVPVMYWVGIIIIVGGGALGIVSDASYLARLHPLSGQSLTLLFGQVASPVWEGFALIAGSLIVNRLYDKS